MERHSIARVRFMRLRSSLLFFCLQVLESIETFLRKVNVFYITFTRSCKKRAFYATVDRYIDNNIYLLL